MAEKSPRPPVTPEQISIDETLAYAMKPEMDRIANDRATAPRIGVLAVQEGQRVILNVPNINAAQAKVHQARQFYAGRDAERVLEATHVLGDGGSPTAADILAADKTLRELGDPNRQPRPEERIRSIVAK